MTQRRRRAATVIDLGGEAALDTLFEIWRDFRTLFEGAHVDAQTIELIRHGFYGGAAACLLLLAQGPPPGVDSDAFVVRLREELHAFRFDLRNLKGGGPWK